MINNERNVNVYDLERDELYNYVTSRDKGLVYEDKDITLLNVKDVTIITSTKHPNLEVRMYNGEFHVYDKENKTWIKELEKKIYSKCTLKGLLKRLDRLVIKFVNDKHFKENKNNIIYGSYRLYKYIELKVLMIRYLESVAHLKSELVILDAEIESTKQFSKLSTHKKLMYEDYNEFRIEFGKSIRTLKSERKEYLANIKDNEDYIKSIQEDINKLKVNNYYASESH